MNIFEKLNLSKKNTKNINTLSNWDSREVCSTGELDSTDVNIIQEFIEIHDNYTTYKNCFINNVFLSEIAPCFYKDKTFIDCEFEIKNLFNSASNLLNYKFKNCTFYIADFDKNLISFNFHKTLENILHSNNNIVYKKSYIEVLANKYNNNLNKVPKNLIKGISINFTDLSECTLPKDKNFFKNLSDTEVHDVKLPEINLNNYDMTKTRLSNIVFTENSILSIQTMKTGIFGSVLPKIDFNEIKKETRGLLNFYNCIFNKDTIFPEDKDFFIKCTIKNSTLPTFDYSDYKISNNTFLGCKFTDKSKIPTDFFTSQNVKNIEKLGRIPSSYLDQIVFLVEFEKPKEFYKKYSNSLSDKSRFVLYKKYNITNTI